VTRRRHTLAALLAAALALAIAAPASARPVPAKPPVEVKIGRATIGTSATDLPSLLVPVRYPIQLAGRLVETRVALLDAGSNTLANQVLHERLSSGRVRLPERRRGFTFVHRVGIDPELGQMPGKLAAVQVVTPPHFDVGIDISPVYPSRFSCSRLGFKVDGPSVQSTPTQDELELLHPLSFCDGPAGGGPPWVISGDTGIHPSAAGYAQMASQVPPPG
jgi:hypothetical protein